MSETRTTKPCGCVVTTVGTGRPFAGTMTTYCSKHSPFRNIASQVEIIP